jgi:hypothetical protein
VWNKQITPRLPAILLFVIRGVLTPAASPAPKRELWQLLRDERTLKDRLQAEQESVKPDQVMFESLRGQLRKVKDEIRNLPSAQNDIRNTGKPLPGENSHPDLPMSTQPHYAKNLHLNRLADGG